MTATRRADGPAWQVAVCGPAHCTEQEAAWAYRTGGLLGERGVTVLCGGGSGVMAAVAAGASAVGGLVIGVLPGADPGDANPHLSATIVTNLGQARNVVIVQSADAVIAIGGSWGTLSEVAHAMRRGNVPVISLGGWSMRDSADNPVAGIRVADSPETAVALACAGST